MNLSQLLFFIISLAVGAGLGVFAYNYWFVKKKTGPDSTKEASILLERIEKVFKVVMAEGYFTEIYNYQQNKNIWNLIQDRKKALLIAKAKVLVGYDFGKMQFHISETDRSIVVDFFPEPEILSMDTDYKFYDIEQGWLNRFQSDDYTSILNEAKVMMNKKALESDLPRIANNQIQLMMIQMATAMNWKVDLQIIDHIQSNALKSGYRDTNAGMNELRLEEGQE
jgi:hypothetical protein